MSHQSRRLAGILLVLFPTVIYGGVSLLGFLIDARSGYAENPLRQDLWRAGHAHAGVLLILSLVVLRYVDQAVLPERLKGFVRHAIPAAAVLLPTAFFLSVLSPTATEPNALISLAFVGAAILAIGLVTLGVGLLRTPAPTGATGLRPEDATVHNRRAR
jgi:hypothetical protein